MIKDVQIGGIYYQIYYPDGVDPNNVNPDTQVAIYMHGGGSQSADSKDALNYLRNGNTDSIIIIPNTNNRFASDFYGNVVNMYDNFISDNGINQNNLVISGFSSGYYSTFGILDDYLAKHPDSDAASVYLVETYIQGTDPGQYKYNYDAYKNNGTMFYSYTGRYKYPSEYTDNEYASLGSSYTETLNPLTDNGCNVINILEGRSAGHHGAEQVFFQDGVIDFSKGRITLSGEKYSYQIRNPETGIWEDVDVGEIDTLDKLCERFGITNLAMVTDDSYLTNLKYLASLGLDDMTISNDSDVLLSNISNIYSTIKSTTFVTNNYSCGAVSASSTKVPASIPEVINSYFSSVSTALCSLGVFLKKCEEANTSMEETEKSIGDDADSLNDDKTVTLGASPSTDTNGSDKNGSDPATTPATTTPGGAPTYNKPTGGSPKSGQPKGGSSPKAEQPATDTPKTDTTDTVSDWKSEFPEYDQLYSTDDKIVFDYNNEYRVIVHRNGETITGIEYYYNFGSSENAMNSLPGIVNMYQNDAVENILMKDKYVKVIFNENMYGNLSVSQLINKYTGLKELVRM